MIYQSLIESYLSDEICVWGDGAKSLTNKFLVLQKRALRLIYFASSYAHAVPLFVESKILAVGMIYFETVANLMHGIWKGLAPALRLSEHYLLGQMKFMDTALGMLLRVIIIRKKLSCKFSNVPFTRT